MYSTQHTYTFHSLPSVSTHVPQLHFNFGGHVVHVEVGDLKLNNAASFGWPIPSTSNLTRLTQKVGEGSLATLVKE